MKRRRYKSVLTDRTYRLSFSERHDETVFFISEKLSVDYSKIDSILNSEPKIVEPLNLTTKKKLKLNTQFFFNRRILDNTE